MERLLTRVYRKSDADPYNSRKYCHYQRFALSVDGRMPGFLVGKISLITISKPSAYRNANTLADITELDHRVVFHARALIIDEIKTHFNISDVVSITIK